MNKIIKTIEKAKKIVILTHKRPDGDAISSSLAVYWYLLGIGKAKDDIDIIIPKYIEEYSFIPGIEYLKKAPTKKSYDLAICLDCPTLSRLEGWSILKHTKTIICIDHHEKETIYADYNIIEPELPSCTCVLYKIMQNSTSNFLDCIAIGLISDTANLQFNVTDEAKQILEQLKSKNVDIEEIRRKLSTPSKRTKELTNIAIERGKIYPNDVFATYLLQKDLLESERNLFEVNTKSVIQQIMDKDIKFTSFVLMVENPANGFKCSLRTNNNNLDLNKVCHKLIENDKIIKGGGHKYSAGCMTPTASHDEVLKFLIPFMKE